MNALEQLDRLRREAVEQARLDVQGARARVLQAEQALRSMLRREHAADARLARARADYAAAHAVSDLRAAELKLHRARTEVRAERALRERGERAHAEARAVLGARERALLEAELGRRAVEGRLARQASDVGRRTEQKREEEADDAFRATRQR